MRKPLFVLALILAIGTATGVGTFGAVTVGDLRFVEGQDVEPEGTALATGMFIDPVGAEVAGRPFIQSAGIFI